MKLSELSCQVDEGFSDIFTSRTKIAPKIYAKRMKKKAAKQRDKIIKGVRVAVNKGANSKEAARVCQDLLKKIGDNIDIDSESLKDILHPNTTTICYGAAGSI